MKDRYLRSRLVGISAGLTNSDNLGQREVMRHMRVRRKPPEPAEYCRELLVALRELHLRAGAPSTRSIARSTGNEISHDTVNRILKGSDLPQWRSLEFIVKALEGDVETFLDLWVSARRAMGEGSGPGEL